MDFDPLENGGEEARFDDGTENKRICGRTINKAEQVKGLKSQDEFE